MDNLKSRIPSLGNPGSQQQVSDIYTLHSAINYIKHLKQQLEVPIEEQKVTEETTNISSNTVPVCNNMENINNVATPINGYVAAPCQFGNTVSNNN